MISPSRIAKALLISLVLAGSAYGISKLNMFGLEGMSDRLADGVYQRITAADYGPDRKGQQAVSVVYLDETAVDRVAERLRRAAAAYVLHEEADRRLSAVPLPDAGDIVLVIGPEGGIDDRELLAFDAAVPVRLGAEVLRTSTAGVAALAVLATRLGRW